MKHNRSLLVLLGSAAAAFYVVYLIAGPGGEVLNRPLALVGMTLIGLGLIKASRQRTVAAEA